MITMYYTISKTNHLTVDKKAVMYMKFLTALLRFISFLREKSFFYSILFFNRIFIIEIWYKGANLHKYFFTAGEHR